MLTNEQILQLMDEVAAKGLGRLEIERAGFRLRIDGPRPQVVAAPAAVSGQLVSAPGPHNQGQTPPAPSSDTSASDPSTDLHVITSPIVGTFYEAPSPDAAPFVRVGDTVVAGQVVCIVEAMKLMNEIEADVSGEVVEIFGRNQEPVEFQAPLFGVKLSS